ncbi:hypothetical protein [Chryseobacterium foetidum]|nr:hypothetical protein [Chryseobacterium foetidum]
MDIDKKCRFLNLEHIYFTALFFCLEIEDSATSNKRTKNSRLGTVG